MRWLTTGQRSVSNLQHPFEMRWLTTGREMCPNSVGKLERNALKRIDWLVADLLARLCHDAPRELFCRVASDVARFLP